MNQKVMRTHFAKPGYVNSGDILQCPACRWKFVLLPGMVQDKVEEFHIPGYYSIVGQTVSCPKCQRQTDLTYYQELSLTGGIELTNWGKPEPKKEKPNGKKRSRKSISK